MQKKWIIALCALIVVAAAWTGLAGVSGVNYAGFISNAYPVHMDLVINGTQVTGSYYYDRQGISISLKGKLENGGTLRMLEYDPQGKCTGWFEGELRAGGIRGIWSTPDGTTMMSLPALILR